MTKKCNNCNKEFEVDMGLLTTLELSPDEIELCDDCYFEKRLKV